MYLVIDLVISSQVKKESAQTEKAWEGAGQKVGLQIWRIVKFKVTHWPKEDYGKFFSGDSYIIMNTYKEPNTEVRMSHSGGNQMMFC